MDDVAPWIQFDPHNYRRNLVARTDRWELRLHCWRPGQTTTLHGHGASACAFRVIRGSAFETRIGARDAVLPPGSLVDESAGGLVHQVGNAANDALLTLHAYAPPLPIDAPSARAGRSVVIVGGGASGIAVAVHLLARNSPDLRVYVVERGPWIGRGVAYGVESGVFRLNVPAGKMSLDPRRPGDFAEWAGADPGEFLGRAAYGSYLEARLADAVRASPAKVRIVRGDVVAADHEGVLLADGRRIDAEAVVLATGIAPRVAPSELPVDSRVVDAWDECALAALPREGAILVLGAGLSALDVVALCEAQGHRGSLTILSRRGLLPRPHLSPSSGGAPTGVPPATAAAAPRALRPLIRWVRDHVLEQTRAGRPWQHALDALRPHTASLYRGLPAAERARFVRSVRPYWEVLRHRAPPESLDRIARLRSHGSLEVVAGRVARCTSRGEGLDVEIALAGGGFRTSRYDAIVRCIGPALDPSEAQTPLVRALVESGLAKPDAAGLGIETDEEGRVVTPSGRPSERLYALGAVRRASSWEVTAMPDITGQALALAAHLVP
jgi:uncharacterized NAD(P)/FAD-binding protein YdhS